MSITDELREFIEKRVWKDDYRRDNLLAIADRIDAEHERLMEEQYKSLTVDMKPMTDENMAADGWIRLPKDADGEYVHIGDVMAYADNTKPMKVIALIPPAVFCTEEGPRYADMCCHYHAPTVEDVLRELVGKAQALSNVDDEDELVAEFAKRLTLAGDAE